MLHDRLSESRRSTHRLAHQILVIHKRAVICERDGAGFGETLQVGDLPSETPLGYAGGRSDADGQGVILYLLAQPCHAVTGRCGVRHGRHASESTGGGGSRSAPASLRSRHPGIAEMHVDIAESLELQKALRHLNISCSRSRR